MTDKKQLILNYLDTNLFYPIMYAPDASPQLKHDFEHTRQLIGEFSPSGILNYIWTILGNKEIQLLLNNRLIDEGFSEYTMVLDHFKNEFTYDWLMS